MTREIYQLTIEVIDPNEENALSDLDNIEDIIENILRLNYSQSDYDDECITYIIDGSSNVNIRSSILVSGQ